MPTGVVSHEEEKAITIDGLEPRVPRAVQLEGAGLYLHRRVTALGVGPGRVHAVVRGGRPYDVTVSAAGPGKAAVCCDCAGFRQTAAPCRHVWAVLIKIQNEDLMRLPTRSAAAP
jgi:hypothetical protein